jgi:tRNA dimethylallyltransferase
MMADGLLHEVEQVLTLEPSRTARQALGYRELIDHLEGRCSLDEAIDATVTRTRQFAVKQERWFRRDPRIEWIDIESDPVVEVAPAITKYLP